MKISLNWIKDYVALDASIEELSKAITFLGFEVEAVISTGAPALTQVVVGEVLTRDKHPNADKLSICNVDIGPAGGVKRIVCGAQNYKVGDRVPVALPGAVLPGNFVIKQSKIRGELSDGMMCSGKELGMGEDHSGLLILTERPEIGKPINDVLPPGDTVIDVEVTPNRPDCLSHLGLARELAAWFKKDLRYPQPKFHGLSTDATRADLLSAVRVDDAESCPLYTAHIIAGVRIGPSPDWLQARLKSIGLRPINNVVDVTNYVMFEYGQPLHAFDAAKVAGAQIVVRRAGDGEKIVTLDEKERLLNSRMLVIADANRPQIVAGVMGGMNSGVSADTTDLILEGAIFRARSVRWTSKRLALGSDSSYRYERGVDPHTTLEAVYRAIDLITATAGGTVVGPVYKVGSEVPWRREITVSAAFLHERLGFKIPEADMRASLESLELNVVREETLAEGTVWTVAIPSWRDDLDRPVDLVEEVLRLYGTDKIPPATVRSPGLMTEDDPVVLFNRKASAYLVGHDFNECVNTTLRPEAELSTWISEAAAKELRLENPFVEDQSHLRPTLITGLLDSLKLNRSRGVPVAQLFEVGRVFVEANGQNWECAAVAFVIIEDGVRRWKQRAPADFYTAKKHVESIAALAGVLLPSAMLADVTGPASGWQAGQSAAAGSIDQGWVCRMGLLNLAMVRAYGLEGKVYGGVFAILPEKLTAAVKAVKRYQPFSLFPAALRDLALSVPAETTAETVRLGLEAIAAKAATATVALDSVNLFDVYTGAGVGEGKKSLAFSLVFRSAERTLTDDEVNVVFQKIQDDLTATTPYQIRK